MAQTFDIRFAPSAGFLALLAPAKNSFRWKGGGKLRVDSEGISFAVKRGLLTLFPSTRRVAADSIRDVYREGEGLHLTFETPEIRLATVSCWAADAGTAAEIVQLLPTRRTLEIEHVTFRPEAKASRHKRSMLSMLLVIAAASALVGLLLTRQPGEPLAAPAVEAPIIPVAVNLVQPRLVLPGDYVLAIPRDGALFAVASRQVEAFEKDAAALLDDYRLDRSLLESGAMNAETFVNRLAALELSWWNVTFRIMDDHAFGDFALLDLRATLMAAARHWRAFLAGHAEGLRKGDHVKIAASFDELARAEELQSRARRFLR